ncbi:MAG: outer membrane beta-barrel protein [Bacteroidales bacterium]|nr:outer membrane beta-barrel protein [Bacteroidales bacterium]
MKKKAFYLTVAAMVAAIGTTNAQLTIRAGALFPQGKYADAMADFNNNVLRWGVIDKSNKGGAGLGASVGGSYRFDMGITDFGIVLAADVMFNSLNTDIYDYFDEMVEANENTYKEFSVSTPVYFNIPVTAGLNYQKGVSTDIDLYGEAGIGLNFRKLTTAIIYSNTGSSDQEETTTFETSTSFAFRFGAGMVFKKKYVLSLDYYLCGSSRLASETVTEVNGRQSGSPESEKHGNINPSILALRLGIIL